MSKIYNTINLYNALIKKYLSYSDLKFQDILETAEERYNKCKKLTIKDRCCILGNVVHIVEDDKKNYAEQLALEICKPITQSIAEIEKCASMRQNFQGMVANFQEKAS